MALLNLRCIYVEHLISNIIRESPVSSNIRSNSYLYASELFENFEKNLSACNVRFTSRLHSEVRANTTTKQIMKKPFRTLQVIAITIITCVHHTQHYKHSLASLFFLLCSKLITNILTRSFVK